MGGFCALGGKIEALRNQMSAECVCLGVCMWGGGIITHCLRALSLSSSLPMA